jgi:hypothetical protein
MTSNDNLPSDLSPELISRREAVLRVATILGGVALIGSGALISGCRPERAKPFTPFTPDEVAYLDEIADTILPTTKTPGAKAAKTGAFMALMVQDTYSDEDQQKFREGMLKLDDASKDKNGGKTFMQATPQQRLALLQELDREQYEHGQKEKAAAQKKSDAFIADQRQSTSPGPEANTATEATKDTPNSYFRMMKQLALLGYFTSEIGMTQAQRYIESPGHYDPCVDYKPGELSWADHA